MQGVESYGKSRRQAVRYVTFACVLLALFALATSLALTRGGSYLPSGVPGLYLTDAAFFAGVVGGTALCVLAGYRLPRGLWVLTVVSLLYCGVQVALARVAGLSTFLALRDLAPFIYLCAVPGLAYLIAQVNERQIIWLLRIASGVLCTWLAISFLGFDLAKAGAGVSQHLFTLRADVAGVVLAIGILTWGQMAGLQGVPVLQMIFGTVGLLIQSRVAAASIVAAGLIVVIREPGSRARLRAGLFCAITLVMGVVASRTLTGQSENRWTDAALPGLTRALDPTDRTASGTWVGRLDTWADVAGYVSRWPQFFVGGGPATDALRDACRGQCLVAGPVTDLRYPHNIELSILLYQGVLGLALFLGWLVYVVTQAYVRKPTALQWFGLLAFLGAAQFGVVLESPFGLIPWVFFLAWIFTRPEVQRSPSLR